MDASGIKQADYYTLDQALTGITTADITADDNRIIIYGAYNGGVKVTCSYGEPYAKA